MDKIVLITGATGGYGLATAKKFKKNGDTVLIASRDAEKVKKVVEEYSFAEGYVLDVTKYSDWVKVKTAILEKYRRIDVLVNNAGGGVRIAEVAEQTAEEIDCAIALNLNSVIYGSQIFAPLMKEQKSGTIVNISSVCARHCWGGWSVYAAAKAGVLNFTKGLYVELRPFGVRATCIIPAAASTGFQKSAGIAEECQTLYPEHIADAVFYAANQPEGVVVEEMTVWGTSQDVQPL
ncbi:MAG: SDR family oxidoreductase [Ruminococcaceae bacterium]|nr:SDR family oxidoreductase [Oscillospiraceae bacterium]